jgi:hypothetical protein
LEVITSRIEMAYVSDSEEEKRVHGRQLKVEREEKKKQIEEGCWPGQAGAQQCCAPT